MSIFQSYLKRILMLFHSFFLIVILSSCDNANNNVSNKKHSQNLQNNQISAPKDQNGLDTRNDANKKNYHNQAVDIGGIPIHPDLPEEHTNN